MREVNCEGLQATNNSKSVLFAIINCSETASVRAGLVKRLGTQQQTSETQRV